MGEERVRTKGVSYLIFWPQGWATTTTTTATINSKTFGRLSSWVLLAAQVLPEFVGEPKKPNFTGPQQWNLPILLPYHWIPWSMGSLWEGGPSIGGPWKHPQYSIYNFFQGRRTVLAMIVVSCLPRKAVRTCPSHLNPRNLKACPWTMMLGKLLSFFRR